MNKIKLIARRISQDIHGQSNVHWASICVLNIFGLASLITAAVTLTVHNAVIGAAFIALARAYRYVDNQPDNQ